MKRFTLLGIIIGLIAFSSPAYAYGPITHINLTKPIMDAQDTPIAQLCKPYERQFYAGLMIPDITVLYYYENYPMGQRYMATHNWNFESRCFELAGDRLDKKCLCYGISTHLIQDTITHNYMVPEKISESWTPNWLEHPAVEGAIEGWMIENYPDMMYLTAHSMDILFEPGGEEYLDMIQEAIGSTAIIDVKQEAHTLSTMLGSFYTDAYAPREESWFFYLWRALSPLASYFADIKDAEVWMDESRDYTRQVFQNWAIRLDPTVTPHGSQRIAEADVFPALLWTIIPILFVAALYIYLIRKIGIIKKVEDWYVKQTEKALHGKIKQTYIQPAIILFAVGIFAVFLTGFHIVSLIILIIAIGLMFAGFFKRD